MAFADRLHLAPHFLEPLHPTPPLHPDRVLQMIQGTQICVPCVMTWNAPRLFDDDFAAVVDVETASGIIDATAVEVEELAVILLAADYRGNA